MIELKELWERECLLRAFSTFSTICSKVCITPSQTTNFRVCRQQFENDKKFSKWVENTVGKRRNCSLRAISPFPSVFSKDFCCKHVKTMACLGKGKLFPKQQNFRLVQVESIIGRRQIEHGSKIKFCFGKGIKHCRKRTKCWLT